MLPCSTRFLFDFNFSPSLSLPWLFVEHFFPLHVSIRGIAWHGVAHRQCLFTLLILYCCRAIFQPNEIPKELIQRHDFNEDIMLIMLFYSCRKSHNFPHGGHSDRYGSNLFETLGIDRRHHRRHCCHLRACCSLANPIRLP